MPISRTPELSDRLVESWRREYRHTPARLATPHSSWPISQAIVQVGAAIPAADWTTGQLYDPNGTGSGFSLPTTVGDVHQILPDASGLLRYQRAAVNQRIINPWPFRWNTIGNVVFCEPHFGDWIITGAKHLFCRAVGVPNSGKFDYAVAFSPATLNDFGGVARIDPSDSKKIELLFNANDLWCEVGFHIEGTVTSSGAASAELKVDGSTLMVAYDNTSSNLDLNASRPAQLSKNQKLELTYTNLAAGSVAYIVIRPLLEMI